MKQVGARREPAISPHASGRLLAEGARFNEALGRLSPSTFIPQGVYRFASPAQANQQVLDCLARGMAQLARLRK